MSLFEQQLKNAKNKQFVFYIIVIALSLLTLVIIALGILTTRGTRITIQPDEAAIQSNTRVVSGLAVMVDKTIYSFSFTPTIEISADGFETTRWTLASDNFGKVIMITLIPLPAQLKLRTDLGANEVDWLIDGKILASGTTFDYALAAGDYQLQVQHPYYQTQTLALSLARGSVFEKTLKMLLIDGYLQIETTPTAIEVTVNDINVGIAPLTLTLPGGEHQVSISHSAYQAIRETIEISNDHLNVDRHYRLQAAQAKVNVDLKPADGQLLLDGIAIMAPNEIDAIAAIEHQLEYTKQGYFPQSKAFTADAGETLNLVFELEKEMGIIDIESSPIATVQVNDEFVGMTPLQLSLHAVTQRVTLSKEDFRSVTKMIIPSAHRKQRIKVSLNAEKDTLLKEAPKQYTHKAGGHLKLFKPNTSFSMGSERSEKGQRANEFIKQIKLSKAFYAGVHEVTQAEYSQYDTDYKDTNPNYPATSISWLDAAKFCNWLSQLEGLKPVYHMDDGQLQGINGNSIGYRLLTEAEWAWLAKKAGKVRQTKFVWGNQYVIPKNAANVADESAKGKVKIFVSKYNDSYAEIAPVGSFTQEASGLYDQAGNVSEWVHDNYLLLPLSADTVLHDPLDLGVSDTYVVKGANWRSGHITKLRPAFRDGFNSSDRRDDLGFRIGRYIHGAN